MRSKPSLNTDLSEKSQQKDTKNSVRFTRACTTQTKNVILDQNISPSPIGSRTIISIDSETTTSIGQGMEIIQANLDSIEATKQVSCRAKGGKVSIPLLIMGQGNIFAFHCGQWQWEEHDFKRWHRRLNLLMAPNLQPYKIGWVN